jgi:hypothetical protein
VCLLVAVLPLAPLVVWAVVLEIAHCVGVCGVVWMGGRVRFEPVPLFPFLSSAGGRALPSLLIA